MAVVIFIGLYLAEFFGYKFLKILTYISEHYSFYKLALRKYKNQSIIQLNFSLFLWQKLLLTLLFLAACSSFAITKITGLLLTKKRKNHLLL